MSYNYERFYKNIAYKFNDENLLIQALTHKSKQKIHNERLEFLGDSILNFIITEELYKTYSEENEGKLSLWRINLIKGKTLAKIAKRFELEKFISCGYGEIKSQGYKRERLLEDTLEALIGAIYLDSNFETIQNCILKKWYKSKLNYSHVLKYKKDPKSQLQEYLQKLANFKPSYTIISTQGKDHEKIFTSEVDLGSLKKKYRAKGKTKKIAESNAALIALKDIKIE